MTDLNTALAASKEAAEQLIHARHHGQEIGERQ